MRISYALSLVFFFFMSVANAEIIPGSQFQVGNWAGAAYTSDENGRFSHCAISAQYVSGNTLYFSVTSGVTVVVGVSGPNLNFQPGQRIPVSLNVDNRQPFMGVAEALSEDFALLEIDEYQRAMTAFAKGYNLRIQTAQGYGDYSLKDTFKALTAAHNCSSKFSRYVSAPSGSGNPTSEIDPTVTFQLATNMITELGVKDARFLKSDELDAMELGGAVYWVSEETGVSGGVMFFDRPSDFDLQAADGTTINYFTRQCDGEVATTVKNIDSNAPSRQVRVLCVSDDYTFESFVTNTKLSGLQMVTILRFDGNASYTEEKPRTEMNADLAIRNASMVLELQQ